MYPIRPPAVYVHQEVADTPAYMARVERVLSALEDPVEPTVYADSDLPDMIRGGLLTNRRPMGMLDSVADPALMFNLFRFDGRNEDRLQALREQGITKGSLSQLLGHDVFRWANYNQPGDPARHDKVCRPCWRIHLQNGCIHKCAYCGLGGLLIAAVNVEETCRWLGTLIDRHPWQLTYLLDDDADPPCLEPELGTLSEMIEFFGTLENRYLIIHTKTWNTEWMRELKHNGNTIIVWSVSGPTQSRLIEPDTGTTDQRIEAARIAEEAGYQIRYKFKPIVPVRNWRDDAAYTAERIFSRTHPDVISLCCFMWMDIDELKRRLPVDLLDPEFVQAAEAAREAMSTTRARPFPPPFRKAVYEHHLREIRRWNSDIPVSLSTENLAMWRDLQDTLGYTARDYPCGCGPFTVPGAPRLTCHPFTTPVRNDNGEIPGVSPPASS